MHIIQPSLDAPSSPYDRLAPKFLTVTTILGFFSTLSVVLRFVARRLSKSHVGLDDLFSVLSLAVCLVVSGDALWMAYNGAGAHTLRPDQIERYFKGYYIVLTVYPTSPAAARVSILLLYHRIFSPKRAFRVIAMGLAVLNAIWCLGCTCSAIFFCTPISAFWDHSLLPSASCLPPKPVHFALTLSDGFLDLAIIALAIFVLKSLQMSRSKKVGISIIFTLAGCASIISITRTPLSFNDGGGTFSNTVLWILIYCHFAVICPCVPTFGPLFKRTSWDHITKPCSKYFNKLRSSISSPNHQKSHQKPMIASSTVNNLGNNDHSWKDVSKSVVIVQSVRSSESGDEISYNTCTASDAGDMPGDLEAGR